LFPGTSTKISEQQINNFSVLLQVGGAAKIFLGILHDVFSFHDASKFSISTRFCIQIAIVLGTSACLCFVPRRLFVFVGLCLCIENSEAWNSHAYFVTHLQALGHGFALFHFPYEDLESVTSTATANPNYGVVF